MDIKWMQEPTPMVDDAVYTMLKADVDTIRVDSHDGGLFHIEHIDNKVFDEISHCLSKEMIDLFNIGWTLYRVQKMLQVSSIFAKWVTINIVAEKNC